MLIGWPCFFLQERVVGFHVVGPNAGEMTQGYSVAMRKGATKEDFDSTIGIHPTCSEVRDNDNSGTLTTCLVPCNPSRCTMKNNIHVGCICIYIYISFKTFTHMHTCMAPQNCRQHKLSGVLKIPSSPDSWVFEPCTFDKTVSMLTNLCRLILYFDVIFKICFYSSMKWMCLGLIWERCSKTLLLLLCEVLSCLDWLTGHKTPNYLVTCV